MPTGYRPRGVPIELQTILHKLRGQKPAPYKNAHYHKPADAAAAKNVLEKLLVKAPSPVSRITVAPKELDI